MTIVCPYCATSYELSPDALGANGRTVRCVRCKQTWLAEPPVAVVTDAAAIPLAPDVPEAVPPLVEAVVSEFVAAEAQAASDEVSGQADPPPSLDGLAETAPSGVLQIEGKPADFITPDVSTEDAATQVAIEMAPPMPPGQVDAETPVPVEQDGFAPAVAALAEVAGPDAGGGGFVSRRAKRQAMRRKQTKPGVSAAILVLVSIVAALLVWRADIVRFTPQTASLYAAIGLPVNLRGLVFENVKTARETSDGATVLVVEGTIASVAPRPVEVPRVRFGLRNVAGQEIYSWTVLPSRDVLEPGATIAFRSRLASPPADGDTVSVRFFMRGDMLSRMH